MICSICLNDLNDPVELGCGHAFNRRCIAQWFQNHSNCPICRFESERKLSPAVRFQVDGVEEFYPVIQRIQAIFSRLNRRRIHMQTFAPSGIVDQRIMPFQVCLPRLHTIELRLLLEALRLPRFFKERNELALINTHKHIVWLRSFVSS